MATEVQKVSVGSCKLEKAACWVGAGLSAAFFSSLEQLSCIKLDTIEEKEEKKTLLVRRRRINGAAAKGEGRANTNSRCGPQAGSQQQQSGSHNC